MERLSLNAEFTDTTKMYQMITNMQFKKCIWTELKTSIIPSENMLYNS